MLSRTASQMRLFYRTLCSPILRILRKCKVMFHAMIRTPTLAPLRNGGVGRPDIYPRLIGCQTRSDAFKKTTTYGSTVMIVHQLVIMVLRTSKNAVIALCRTLPLSNPLSVSAVVPRTLSPIEYRVPRGGMEVCVELEPSKSTLEALYFFFVSLSFFLSLLRIALHRIVFPFTSSTPFCPLPAAYIAHHAKDRQVRRHHRCSGRLWSHGNEFWHCESVCDTSFLRRCRTGVKGSN